MLKLPSLVLFFHLFDHVVAQEVHSLKTYASRIERHLLVPEEFDLGLH
ncbi:hypothetical protein MtrunA17_Chr1g0160061 [Medicago truncatula]|uniref:Transmembrane protein n=1 Tax=Medicago truncatula TaxID=3880 RepID=A0A396JNT8_MEDTR|nr:hypothetical protein MtrunA17_Chr1g0160061 [Medicago truncatula]